MEQIDVIAYEKDLKKQRLKRLMKNKHALTAALCGIVQIPTILFNDLTFLKIFGGVTIGIEFSLLRNYWKRERIVEETQTVSMMRTTTTYKEMMEEYQKYIKDAAKLVKTACLPSVKENTVYLHALMELGYFSKQMKHQYKLFKHETDYLEEVLGAKVVTGTSVCRHMSSFMADVMNELGYTAANVSCTTNDNDPVKRIQKGNVELDHSVLAVADQESKFLFDATNGCFAALPVDFDFTEIESIHVAQFVLPTQKKYLIVCPHMSTLNFNREKQCEIIGTTKLCKMTHHEVNYLRQKIEKVLNGNMPNQFAFHVTHEPQRRKIESLYQELLPYSDEEITKHILRK
jgi:hypothetical protein